MHGYRSLSPVFPVSALTCVLIQGLRFYHVLQLAVSLGFPLCMWVCLCLQLEFECKCHFMSLCVHITIFSPISSPLFLFWCVWVCLEGQLFFLFLPLSILLSARVSFCLFLSLSILFLLLPASRCPGTLGIWGSGFSYLSAQALRSWFFQR